MSAAEEIIAKDLSLEEILDLLKNKLLEPRYRNLTHEHESNMAMLYLIVKAIVKKGQL